jgi:hypothetical protein
MAASWLVLGDEDIRARLESARIRLQELATLGAFGDRSARLSASEGATRLRLVQEFFFHLIGAVDALAQIVKQRRGLALGDDAGIRTVCKSVAETADDPNLLAALGGLCQPTRKVVQVPSDPYSEDGLILRALLYRHSVTHRHAGPLLFRIGGPETFASLLLNPRNRPLSGNFAEMDAQKDLQAMLDAVTTRCNAALAVLSAEASDHGVERAHTR